MPGFVLFVSYSSLAQLPTITMLSPATVCQDDAVTITGTNFTGATVVKLANTAIDFTINNANSITAHVATNASSGKVSVTTPNGTATSAADLTVKPAPIPGLTDVSTLDIPFTNCDGNINYLLTVANSSIAAGGSCAYDIDWGDGTAHFRETNWAANAQTNHQYTSQGYFVINLTITPANGCTKSVTYNFYNGTNPIASFTTTTSTTGLCTPATIQFKIGNWFNNSPGTSYQINFDDRSPNVTLQQPLNSMNTDQLVPHQYTTSSCPNTDFTATLNVINGCFTTSYTLNQIIIRKKPIADFITQPAPDCLNGPVCFTNMTTDGYSGTSCNSNSIYTWDFGDGSPTSAQQTPPCHTYASAGNYSVSLTASNTACGSDVKIKTVTVIPKSPPPVVSATPVTYCQGETAVPLTATGSGLQWYTTSTGGTGSNIAPTPSTLQAGTKTYYVTQTKSNNCESERAPVSVTVNATPNAPGVNTPVQLCQNQAATPLTATGTNLLWYNNPSGGTGTAVAPTPSTAAIGNTTYYVSQTINSCEGTRASIEVIVGSLPGAPIVTSPVIYCENQAASPLTAMGTGLLWYTVSTGGSSSAAAPTPSTATAGNTTYYVSQVTGCGEGPRAAITVTVRASPSAAISYNKAVLCNAPDNATNPNPSVEVVLTGASGGTFSISPSSGLSINSATGTISPSGASVGSYTITYTIPGSGSCSDFVTTANVTVNGTPSASITYPSICTSDPETNVQLTGSQGGSFSSSPGITINPSTGSITPASSTPGNYVVTYTIAPSSPCPGFTTTGNVAIALAPDAAVSYSPTNLCNVSNTASTPNPPVTVMRTGTAGGAYSILPATGLSISSTTGTLDPSGATAGTYTIQYSIPGAGGCADYNTTTIVTVNGAPTASINYPGSPYCNGIDSLQQVNMSGTSGGSYSSSPGLSVDNITGAINPALSTPGLYTVTYSLPASPPCPGYATSTTVAIDQSPVITFANPSQSICSGGTAVFMPSSNVANTDYQWSVSGLLPAGVSGTSSGATSGANPNITLSFTNTGSTSQSIKVLVSPTNPAGNPCSGTPYELTLTIYPVPAAIPTDTMGICMLAPATALVATPSPGNTINWYDETGTLLNTAPVINTDAPRQFLYFVSQSNNFGCESQKSRFVAIVNPVAKIISASSSNPSTCGVASGSIVLHVLDLNNNPIPGIPVFVHYTKFQINYKVADSTDASGTITVALVAGVYSDIYVETSGCISQKIPDVFVLKDPDPPAQPIAGYNAPLCSGTSLNLSALSPAGTQSGPINYVWVGPAFGQFADTIKNTVVSFPSAGVADEGIYIVYAIQNNCISAATSFQVDIKQAPSKPQISTRTPLCEGDNLTLQAYSSIPGGSVLSYTWSGPGAGFPVNAPNAGISKVTIQDAGIYSVTVSSSGTNCSSTTDTLIEIGGYPIVKFAQDSITLPTGYVFNLSPLITNASDAHILPVKKYEWTPFENLVCNDSLCSSPVATIKDNVCYTVKVTNIYGCSGTDAVCIRVFCQNSQVFIPNAFTPRGTVPGNSTFMVRASGISSVKSFRVFDRWGKLVFERSNFPPNSADFGWDGLINGKPGGTGVYVYTVEVVCENGLHYFFKGNVTLL